MNRSTKSSPVTWGDLISGQAENAANAVAFMEKKIPRLATLSGVDLASAYAGCSGALARGILMCGTAKVQAFVRGFHPHLARVVAALAEQNEQGTPLAHWVLDFALMAESMGVPRPAGFDASLLGPLVVARGEFDDARKRAMAFTALALGDTAAALAFIDEPPAAWDAPVVRFEFNQLELVRYLAAALDQRRPADWIEPAWVEYLGLFPLHISTKAAEWPDVFNVARILADRRSDKVADIADDLHARVQRLAAQGQ